MNWDFVEDGLTKVIGKTGAGFIPADVYTLISNKNLFLYWLIDGTDTIGFTILSEVVTNYEGTKALYLDHTYVDPKFMKRNTMEEFDAALEDLAKKIGCARLEFNSSRIGWGRRIRRMGWEPVTVVYKRDL
jgi:GNAT superfamily N-acetyltransferase